METKEYNKFKLHPANREVTQKAVDNLVLSIKKNGFITGRDILIDEDWQILDGQHRFFALKQLGLPIPYVVTSGGDSMQKILSLNTGQKNWTAMDYIRSYAKQGLDCYRQVVKYKEETNYPDSVAITIAAPQILNRDLKDGKAFYVNEDRRAISVFIDGLNVSYKHDKSFVRALVVLFRIASKEQIKMLGDKMISIPRCYSMDEYLISFENLLNFKKRGVNRIKLL